MTHKLYVLHLLIIVQNFHGIAQKSLDEIQVYLHRNFTSLKCPYKYSSPCNEQRRHQARTGIKPIHPIFQITCCTSYSSTHPQRTTPGAQPQPLVGHFSREDRKIADIHTLSTDPQLVT